MADSGWRIRAFARRHEWFWQGHSICQRFSDYPLSAIRFKFDLAVSST
jgi:hypothetical protein